MRNRLPPEIFDLPVEKMKAGYYSDAYFNYGRETLLADGRHPHVLMQVFQKHRSVLGGMDEAIAILTLCSHGWEELEVRALHDGDELEPWEQSLRIAIASSIPPSTDECFWNTWVTTRGCRPSASSVSRAKLK